MSRFPPFVHRSITRLAAVLALTAVTLFVVAPPPAAAFVCQNNASYVTFYYSSSSHTTRVGECAFPCTGSPTCTGTKSPYFTTIQTGCCSG
jgi:hypothetical protein